MISINELDYQKIPTIMMLLQYYPVKLKYTIMPIEVKLLFLTNFAQICSCF